MKHSLAIFLTLALLLSSCAGSDTKRAMTLVGNARQALSEARYDDARQLIDSLRATYPKEIDARRTALALADSIELQAARAEAAGLDSLLTFKTLELDEAKALFAFEKAEKYQSQGYYVLPRHAGSKSAFSFFPEVEESGKLLLVEIDAQRKYTFTEVPISGEGYIASIKGMELTDEQQGEVAACYRLSQLITEHKEMAARQEKASLKIRFYEKKLSR